MIERWITDKLRDKIAWTSAVALLGVRQVGKTTLAKAVKGKNAIYLDLEAPRDLRKLSDPSSFLDMHSEKLIILDEIQRLPDLFMVLRGFIDNNRERGRKYGQLLLIGPATMNLLRQPSESLAGRIGYMEMHGLNLLEVGGDKKNAQNFG